jgi:hypothetical protein
MKSNLTIKERLISIEDKLDTYKETLDNHLDSHKWLMRLIITLIAAEVLRQVLPKAYSLIEGASTLSQVLPPLTGS